MKQISAIDGIVEPSADIERDRVTLRITLTEEASLRKTVRSIEDAARTSLGGRSVLVEAAGPLGSSESLEDWWAGALFDVAEAMETRQYSLIPAALTELAGESGTMSVRTEMDDRNVYITLRDGGHYKYVILPRQAAMMGVWPNE